VQSLYISNRLNDGSLWGLGLVYRLVDVISIIINHLVITIIIGVVVSEYFRVQVHRRRHVVSHHAAVRLLVLHIYGWWLNVLGGCRVLVGLVRTDAAVVIRGRYHREVAGCIGPIAHWLEIF